MKIRPLQDRIIVKRMEEEEMTKGGIIIPFPTAITLPSIGFSFAESGIMIPPLVISSSSILFTIIRSCNGLIFIS